MNLNQAILFCQFCGTKYEASLLSSNIKNCTNCGKKFFLNYSIGVGAICYNKNREVLIIRRNIEPHKGKLDIPAGFVDISDQSLEDALKRELKEETGFSIKNIKYLSSKSMDYTYNEITKPHLSIFFECEVDELSKASNETDGESIDIKFVDVKNVDESEIGFEVVKELFRNIKLNK